MLFRSMAGFLLALNGGRRGRWGNVCFGLAGGILLFFNVMITSYQEGFSEYAVLLDLCILIFWSLIGLKGPRYQVLVSIVICQISLIIANVGSLEFVHILTRKNISFLLEGKNIYRTIELVSGKLLWAVELVLIFITKKKFLEKRQDQYSGLKGIHLIRWGGIWIVLLCGIVTIYATNIVLMTIRENKELNQEYANQIIGVIIGFLLLNLVILGLMGLVFWQKRRELEIAATRQLLEVQKQSYEHVLSYYDVLRKKQHDLKNALLAGKELAKKKNYDMLDPVFDQICENLLQTGEHLTENKGRLEDSCETALWLALLDYQEQRLAEQKIPFWKEIKLGDYQQVAGIDLCVIIGNLLDNAIEATEQEAEENRKISLYMEAQFGAVYVRIKNKIRQSVLKNQGIETSSKKEKEGHGYGIKGVQEIAAKYNGKVVFSEKEQEFIAEVLLYTVS